MAVYNDLNPYTSQWLANLAHAGEIADGEVICGPIDRITPEDVRGKQFHAFAGIGVWSLALRRAGISDSFPLWTGSCPCQPFSNLASPYSEQLNDHRHVWPAWFRLIRECRPPIIFGEQVSSAFALEWFDEVAANLESEDYAVASADLCSAGVNHPHPRQRLFFVAYSNSQRPSARNDQIPHDERPDLVQPDETVRRSVDYGVRNSFGTLRGNTGRRYLVPDEPGFQPLVTRSTTYVERVSAYGNAIDAEVAATFIRAAVGYWSKG